MLILFPFVVVSFHRLIHHGSNPVVIIDYINLLRKLPLSCSNLKPPSCYQIMSHFLWGFVKTSHCHVKIISTCSPHGPRRAQVRDLGLGQFACMLRSLLSASTAVLTPFVLAGCPMSLPCLLCHVVHASSADIPTICRLHSSIYQCNVYDMQTCTFLFTNLNLYFNKNIHYICVKYVYSRRSHTSADWYS